MKTKEARMTIVVIEDSDAGAFEQRCSDLIADDYELLSSNCGFVNSEEYNFASIFQAVFQDRRVE